MLTAFAIMLIILTFRRQQSLPINTWSFGFILGLTIIYCIGVVDDLIGLNATTKFAAQIVSASLLPLVGLYINNLHGFCGVYEIPVTVGIPLTIFVIVFIDNALNLIDGIDGLASGLSFLALGGFLLYFIHYQVFTYTYTFITVSMMGALLAFIYFNLFGKAEKNSKIFMGDSGSLSLGFTLGFLAVKCAMNNTNIWPERDEALLLPVTLLFVPVADMVRVIIYRISHRKPLFKADKNHIHHKLMRAGLNQHQTLAVILLLTISIYALNYLLYPTFSSTAIVAINTLIYILVNIAINHSIKSVT
jgi:UDP-N-acetylmuramyl pentapeptide phosphotransferase/UDP-N-acetylglucosamine-1-phosphate transferase